MQRLENFRGLPCSPLTKPNEKACARLVSLPMKAAKFWGPPPNLAGQGEPKSTYIASLPGSGESLVTILTKDAHLGQA